MLAVHTLYVHTTKFYIALAQFLRISDYFAGIRAVSLPHRLKCITFSFSIA